MVVLLLAATNVAAAAAADVDGIGQGIEHYFFRENETIRTFSR
jgi:hypothetical protein